MNRQNIFQAVQMVGIISIIIFLALKNEPAPIYKVSPIKTVEKLIEGKEIEIKTIETRIGNENKIIEAINVQLLDLKKELERVKSKRDTFNIVQIQDTIITKLDSENFHLKNVVVSKDSIILAQRYVIGSKDTIISVGNYNLKKIKRQRNVSILINAFQTGLLILK